MGLLIWHKYSNETKTLKVLNLSKNKLDVQCLLAIAEALVSVLRFAPEVHCQWVFAHGVGNSLVDVVGIVDGTPQYCSRTRFEREPDLPNANQTSRTCSEAFGPEFDQQLNLNLAFSSVFRNFCQRTGLNWTSAALNIATVGECHCGCHREPLEFICFF
jgi:hypothetical protein